MAQNMWYQLMRILGLEESNTRVSGTFFKEAVQTVLIFALEKFLMNPHMGRAMSGFHVVVVVVDIFHQSVRLVQIMRWWVSNLRH